METRGVIFVDILSMDRLLVMEYATHGTLRDYESKYESKYESICHAQLYRLAEQMTPALSYIHREGTTHRDVKPLNILIVSNDPDMTFKLADFSDSHLSSRLKSFCGSELYRAPKIDGEGYYSDTIDIWSLAVVLIERWYD
ncbi:kinase-like protein [Mollisia scopiformis]|uniref:Kinase-like protein n=1 Tax=Mollisia scopiformis TaxID=149040 RepID=A0A194XGP4_MOLSC|nr:kinase-like protein [Mollisia scopiformis]KUJ19304.1 kinase-like protein [Mollisia scopiformis]